LHNKGIYRVPGNTTAISSLQADVEKVICGYFLEDGVGINTVEESGIFALIQIC